MISARVPVGMVFVCSPVASSGITGRVSSDLFESEDPGLVVVLELVDFFFDGAIEGCLTS